MVPNVVSSADPDSAFPLRLFLCYQQLSVCSVCLAGEPKTKRQQDPEANLSRGIC